MSYVSLCVTDSQLGGIKNTDMSLISSYLPQVIEKRERGKRGERRKFDGSHRHKLSTGQRGENACGSGNAGSIVIQEGNGERNPGQLKRRLGFQST